MRFNQRFWEFAIKTASPQSQKRFIKEMGAYAQAVLQKAADHRDKHIRSVQEYFVVRREAIGARPAFGLIELDMDLPDEAVHHPVIEEMTTLAIDMIILDNVSCANLCHFLKLIGRAPAIGYRVV